MTALRNFPDAPLARRRAKPIEWKVPAMAMTVWNALHRYGQLRAAAAECRQGMKSTSTQR